MGSCGGGAGNGMDGPWLRRRRDIGLGGAFREWRFERRAGGYTYMGRDRRSILFFSASPFEHFKFLRILATALLVF